MITNDTYKPSFLEKFGLFYLRLFKQKSLSEDLFSVNDNFIAKQINKSKKWAVLFTILVSIISVLPIVWVDIEFEGESVWVHYGMVFFVTIISIIIELYLLFVIALKLVHDLRNHLQVKTEKNDTLFNGVFGINNILARTALQLPDPEMKKIGRAHV